MFTCCQLFRFEGRWTGRSECWQRGMGCTQTWGHGQSRRRVLTGQISKRGLAKSTAFTGRLWRGCSHTEPSGYRRSKSRTSKLDRYARVIEQILKKDKSSHRKQRHTAKKIFERLRDEHGYAGGHPVLDTLIKNCEQPIHFFARLCIEHVPARTTNDGVPEDPLFHQQMFFDGQKRIQ